ncbi:MAG: aminotransferase class I/II-fold pyridoxal phosphate-dependent enzyme [Pseudoflavonifractor sp.]
MGPTPLYDALTAFAGENALRLHMPGHKGGNMPLPGFDALAAIDFTELPPTGDLFAGDGPIRAAEGLWAAAFGMAHCLFLTGGSTEGMLAALTLACPPGSGILLDRGCHRSVYNALAILDLQPVYLHGPWLERAGVTGPIDPDAVERALTARPDIKILCITSPTYYGVLSDIPALAAVLHRHGGILVVDAAHGAHLPFLGNGDLSAADLVVTSAHKTLPALGQSALLFAGDAFSHRDLRRAAGLYGSSSPSYVLMASLDGARAWMEDEGAAAYRTAAMGVAALRKTFPCLSEGDAPLDPTRFVQLCDGFAVQKALETRGIYPEMADRDHVVYIFTCADRAQDFARLSDALGGKEEAPLSAPPRGQKRPPPAASMALSPRQARFASHSTVLLADAEGQVSACQIAPYPPGVPVVAPGERIEKKNLAYLSEIGYNMQEKIEIVDL